MLKLQLLHPEKCINTVIRLAHDYVSSNLLLENYNSIPLQYNTDTYIEFSLTSKSLIYDEICLYLLFIFQVDANYGQYFIYGLW